MAASCLILWTGQNVIELNAFREYLFVLLTSVLSNKVGVELQFQVSNMF